MTIKYPHETYHEIIRGDEAIEVLVEYGVDQYDTEPSGQFGPPEHYDPGSGWVFAINENVEADDGRKFTLTDAEYDAIHSYLEENPPEEDGGPDWDY